MKLATRTTLAIGACGVLLFGGHGFLQLRQEERDLQRVAQNEALLLGHSLQVAFENALRDRQIEDVAETLAALSQVDSTVAIYVYGRGDALVGSSAGARASDDTMRVYREARAGAQPIVDLSNDVEPPILRLGLRLRPENRSSHSYIVIEKPMREMARDLARTRRGVLLTTVGFVFAIAGLMWLLILFYVSKPLARMVDDMRRVRAGNLRRIESAPSSDEVGAVQNEFAMLISDLEAEKQRADRELEARHRVERGLQQADKLITLGQLAAVMAHEIGSPLQVLEGRARALDKHAGDAAATRRTAGMLVEQTERITRIVGQMLSITRRRAGIRGPVDAGASVRSVVALLELEAQRRGVRMEVEKTGSCEVVADADQLQQIVLNLVRNALDASPRGGVVLVRLGGADDTFVLEVVDHGAGLSDVVRAHLFEPFVTTKAENGGSGLGLSVVKTIVQDHGGQVDFPVVASGCVVRVELPRREKERTP